VRGPFRLNVNHRFDHFSQSVAVPAGRGDQMTNMQDLTFSARVFIYRQEFLSIQQNAQILAAYQTKRLLHVQFMGNDYLGIQGMAWPQPHDAQASQQQPR
jgi:hypothetical protein